MWVRSSSRHCFNFARLGSAAVCGPARFSRFSCSGAAASLPAFLLLQTLNIVMPRSFTMLFLRPSCIRLHQTAQSTEHTVQRASNRTTILTTKASRAIAKAKSLADTLENFRCNGSRYFYAHSSLCLLLIFLPPSFCIHIFVNARTMLRHWEKQFIPRIYICINKSWRQAVSTKPHFLGGK